MKPERPSHQEVHALMQLFPRLDSLMAETLLMMEEGDFARHARPDEKNMCDAENLLEVLLKYPSATFGSKIELYGPTEHRKHCTS